MHSGGYFFIIHFGLQIQSQKDYPSESMKEWQRNFLKRLNNVNNMVISNKNIDFDDLSH